MITFYKDEGSFSSGDVVNSTLSSCFSIKNREPFREYLENKGKLDNTKEYLDELINWVNGRIKVWQSGVGDSLLKGSDKKVVPAFSKSEIQSNQKKSNIVLKSGDNRGG